MRTTAISIGTKIVQKIALAVVGIAIIIVLWIGYLMFNPIDVLDVKVPLPAYPAEVQAGGTINLNFDYCKYRDIESHIKVDFLGPYVIPTLSSTRHFPMGCHAENLALSIPAGTPAGTYTIRIEINYYVNALRREHYVFNSVEIKVINPDEKPTVQVGDSGNTK